MDWILLKKDGAIPSSVSFKQAKMISLYRVDDPWFVYLPECNDAGSRIWPDACRNWWRAWPGKACWIFVERVSRVDLL